jgi:hypothetical protein
LQPPAGPATAETAARLGEHWVIGSPLHVILSGTAGPRVVLGPDIPVAWSNSLIQTPAAAFVLVDAGHELKPWGPTSQALFYQVLTDVGRGLFERARLHLLRAGALNGTTVAFFYDRDLMLVDIDEVAARSDAFVAGLSRAGARDLYRNLLQACTKGTP